MVAIVGLTGLSVSAMTGSLPGAELASVSTNVPALPGTVVTVALVNMGGPMMNGGNNMMSGSGNGMMGGSGGMMFGNATATSPQGMMGLTLDRTSVAHATVSFVAVNRGGINHELLVLPLSGSQTVGTRAVGSDGKVDESSSLGEASTANGHGAGEGITPGAASWVTLDLAPGRYEVLCNLPGHYAAGMYGELTVS